MFRTELESCEAHFHTASEGKVQKKKPPNVSADAKSGDAEEVANMDKMFPEIVSILGDKEEEK